MFKQWIAAIAGLLLFAGAAFAGVVIHWQDGETAFLEGGKFKSEADGSWVVFDTDNETITSVNDRRQSYSIANINQFCAAVRTLYDEQLSQIPEELRAMVEEQMKALEGQGAPDVRFEIREAGSGGEVAGYPTTRYEVFRDGEKEKEFYLAEKTQANAETEVDKIWDMAFRLSECSDPDGQKSILVVEQDPAYRKLVASGWVMKEVDFSTDELQEEVVLSMEKKAVGPAEFVPPGNYRKLSPVDFMRQELAAEEEETE